MENEICPALTAWIENHPDKVKRLPAPEMETPETGSKPPVAEPIVIRPRGSIVQIHDGKRRRRRWWLWLIGVAVVAGVGYGAYQIGRGSIPAALAPSPVAGGVPSAAPAMPTLEPPTAILSSTSISAEIPAPSPTPQASSTSAPTNTPYPTNTPKPSVSLPFADDFSSGINPPWSVYSGKWLTTGTGATITITDKDPDAGALLLDDPTLTDYRLRVRVHSPGVLSACQGNLGVVVRYQADRDQNLMYFMNSASRFYWGYTDSLSPSFGSLTRITDVMKAIIISDFVMELEASGNSFTAWIDGAKQDSFSLTGYETGGVALVPVCGCPGYCPSFADFSLQPVP